MVDEKTLRAIEGLGYCSAVLIGAAGVSEAPGLKLFHVAGVTIGLVVIVRLLALNAVDRAMDEGPAELSEVTPEIDEPDAEAKEEVTR